MAAVGNLPTNGSLHSDPQKSLKNVAKKSTSKPSKMVNGEKLMMPVSEKVIVMNGQTNHEEDRKRAMSEDDLVNDLESSAKVTKLDVKVTDTNGDENQESKSNGGGEETIADEMTIPDEKAEDGMTDGGNTDGKATDGNGTDAIDAEATKADAENLGVVDGNVQNGDSMEIDDDSKGKDIEKPSKSPSGDADAECAAENGISEGGSDEAAATAAPTAASKDEEEESADMQLLLESGDEGNVNDEDEALLLSDDDVKETVEPEKEAKENNNEKEESSEKVEMQEKKLEESSNKEDDCEVIDSDNEKDKKDQKDNGEIDSGNADKSPEVEDELQTELPKELDEESPKDLCEENDSSKETNKDVPNCSNKDSEKTSTGSKSPSPELKSADSESNGAEPGAKSADSEAKSVDSDVDESKSALEKGKDSEFRDDSSKSEPIDIQSQTTSAEDDATGLQLDLSADSDCMINSDKDELVIDESKNDKDTKDTPEDKVESKETEELNANLTVDLDLEILSDEEEKNKNSKRSASPDLTSDIQPLAKKGRLTSSDSNDDVNGQEDLSDVTCDGGTVTLPVKVLEAFIQKRIRSYLENQTQSRLLKRVEELQNTVTKWREVAKSLEKKVKEVSAMRGGLRSNAKGPSRNMGVQCDVVKLQALQQKQQGAAAASPSPNKVTIPVSASMVSTPTGLHPIAPNNIANNIAFIQTPSGALVAGQNPLVVNSQNTKTVRTLLEQQRQNVQVQVVNNSGAPQTVRVPLSQSASNSQQAVKGFIDLTDDAGSDDRVVKNMQPATVILTSPGTTVPGNSMVLQSVNQSIRPQNTVLVSTVPTTQLRGAPVIVQRAPVTLAQPNAIRATITNPVPRHPAPLPVAPQQKTPSNVKKMAPPRPSLKISRVQQGIVLSWNMAITNEYSDISNYQLFAYQEQNGPVLSTLWKKVGDVRALPLPMACTLTQFQEGNKYHFAVRAVDTHGRIGPFSVANSIHLVANADS